MVIFQGHSCGNHDLIKFLQSIFWYLKYLQQEIFLFYEFGGKVEKSKNRNTLYWKQYQTSLMTLGKSLNLSFLHTLTPTLLGAQLSFDKVQSRQSVQKQETVQCHHPPSSLTLLFCSLPFLPLGPGNCGSVSRPYIFTFSRISHTWNHIILWLHSFSIMSLRFINFATCITSSFLFYC